MSLDAWLTIIVTLACLATLIFTRLGADITLMAGLTVLLLFKVVSPHAAFSGFANPGVLTIAVLYVVAAGLRDTGAIDSLIGSLFGRPRSARGAQLRMMLPVTFMSAFLNNTPIVATFLPAVADWAKRQRISVSKLMMPLSYAAIFGGTCTLIGTSTNLVVDGLLKSQLHLPGFGFFELAWIGIPCAVVGILYVLIASHWLLPERRPAMAQLENPREYTVEMMVEPGSPLTGQTVQAAGLRQLPGLFLIEIERDGVVMPAVGPDVRLAGGDRLVFAGITDSIVDLQRIKGLTPATNQVFKLNAPRTARLLIEAVIAVYSPVCGKTIRDGRFRSRYNAVIIAVARNGQRLSGKIGDIELAPGDTLLLETEPEFLEQHANSREFLLLRPIDGAAIPRHEKSWIAWTILLGLIITASANILPLLQAALLAAGLMLATRCCSLSAARRSIELEVLVAIAAAFGIGSALETSGAAAAFARVLLTAAGDRPWLLLGTIYLITMILTEMVTNNAAAVIMFPLAYATTQSLGLHFMPFAIAITMAASASFATPIGYQTNLMVYGPGGYRFSDYLRFGVPLNLLMLAVSVSIIPHVWPLS
jgi:di/tricarboxylate transporter